MTPPLHRAAGSSPNAFVSLRSRASRAAGRLVENRYGGLVVMGGIAAGVFFVVRLFLLAVSAHEQTWSPALLAAFGWGFVYDLGALAWLSLAPGVVLLLLPRRFFQRWPGRLLAHAAAGGAIFALLFTAVAEIVFWDEFAARFNFIAVDYLVYTTEVIGNIRESYSVPLIIGSVAGLTLVLLAALVHQRWLTRWLDNADQPARERLRGALRWTVPAIALGLTLSQDQLPEFANTYTREIAKNGVWSFFAAFRANELDYAQFYPTVPLDQATARLRAELAPARPAAAAASPDLLRWVAAREPGGARHLNVIQITVESLSASFLARYGNTAGLTPHLDALAPHALVFDQLYATGNRTDRGMEALTLSVPPTPGRSLVKRPANAHLFTLGGVLRREGYRTSFIYGGYGYFDNMNAFFGGNGYRVVDRAAVSADDVTFANAWGACDEDLLRWTLREADRDYAAGQPFFHFVMTTSNHRPFTYPDGRIDLPSKEAGRAGGVKYTDYAINAFLEAAATKPWYRDTIFVIVADHCASSAGRAALPVANYHIPLLIYAPGGQIEPGHVSTLMSQIDYAPTLLGLLNVSYASRFFGRDVLDPANARLPGRALVANYQQLGLFTGDRLEVLSPGRRAVTYAVDLVSGDTTRQAPDPILQDRATAYYQSAGWLFHHGRQQEPTTHELRLAHR